MSKQVRLSNLSFPKGLNLDLLRDILPEKTFERLILENKDRGREERRIILPSLKTIRKCIFYHYGLRVFKKEMTWEEAMKELKGNFKTLKELGISRKDVKKHFKRRMKEIIKELTQ